MQTRRRNLTPRGTATVSLNLDDLKVVDDAAEHVAATRSFFIARAAVKEARRILARRDRVERAA